VKPDFPRRCPAVETGRREEQTTKRLRGVRHGTGGTVSREEAGRPSAEWLSALLAALLLSPVGCGSVNWALQRRVGEEAHHLQPPVEDDKAVVRLAEDTAQHGLPPPPETPLPAEAGLDDYVRIALRDNPGIARAIRQVQVLGYQVPQVTSLDDPMINLIPPTGDMLETAAGMMDGAVGVSQKVPFPGKLSARGRIAEDAVRMALATLADTRIATVAQVQKAYYSYYLADASIQITRQSEQFLQQIHAVAGARYEAGTATQQDVLRAEVELYGLQNDLITLEQQRATAQALLDTLMNRSADAPLPAPRAFELAQVEWKLPQAMQQAAKSNPRLTRLQAQIERDLETVKLARLNYFPDLTLGSTYTFISASGISPVRTGDDAWNLAFGLNLPIWWQRLRARVLEGNAQTLASVDEYNDLRNRLFFELQDTLVKIDTQYRQALLLRDLIVPRAWQTVTVSTSSYQAGTLEFTALIDNWRKWLDFSLGYHRALAELEQRFADLQQLIGVPVPRVPVEETPKERSPQS
jgi:cobalt-zinc-cadmium efflux system outer membrane protein